MKSEFYYEGHHRRVASLTGEYINGLGDFLSNQTKSSTRAVGDALESIIAEEFDTFLGSWCQNYQNEFARRAMADLAFTDKQGMFTIVDVKTHRENTAFNMPNLTSVERLSRLYEDDNNVFSILFIKYALNDLSVSVSDVVFAPIEFLDWECLTVGALGWGQIQIADSNNIKLNDGFSRKKWMLQFCDVMDAFYPSEIAKIHKRLDRFSDVREEWESKKDIWV